MSPRIIDTTHSDTPRKQPYLKIWDDESQLEKLHKKEGNSSLALIYYNESSINSRQPDRRIYERHQNTHTIGDKTNNASPPKMLN